MTQLTVAHTSPQVESLTKNELIKHFLSDSGLGVVGTATGGSEELLIDTTARQSSQYNPATYEGQWIRINKTSNGAAPEGEMRSIARYLPAAGSFQVSPQFSVTIESGDGYEIWRVDPQRVLDLLDRVLEEDIFVPCWTMLSELPDFDMELSTKVDWTDSNATSAKSSVEPPMSGERYLTVTASGANGYARTPLINVEPGKPYHCSTLARYSTSNGILRVYDETNAAVIKDVTIDRRYNIRPSFDFNTPATCHQISIRLVTVTNAGVTAWDEVVVYSQEARSIALPSWVKSPGQVRAVYRLRGEPIQTDLWSPELRGEPLAYKRQYDFIDNPFGRGQLRLSLVEGLMTHPLYIFGLRNETTFADNYTEVKHIDLTHALIYLCYRVFNNLLNSPDVAYLERKWLAEQRNEYSKKYTALNNAIWTASQDGNYGH